jgi:sigma-B regulation protein RsbU (phosphoserine phosphatase)
LACDLLRLYSNRLDHSENVTIKDLQEKNRQLTQAYHDLKIAQAAMIEKEKLDEEMRLAGKIQRSILPKLFPDFAGLDFGALMIPAKQVGGDFYDFIVLDDHRVGIVIGDVCDKGMPAALLMALTYSSVRMEALRNDAPENTLQAVNRHLIQVDCSDMFVTLLYGILDCETLQFNYARAGHPIPLLLDEKHKPISVPYNLGQAVGIFNNFEIDQEKLSIPKGGTLVVYSDGLSETLQDHPNAPKLYQLCTTVMNAEDQSAQACCEQLWKTVGGTEAESLIKDDFTVVVVKSVVSGD